MLEFDLQHCHELLNVHIFMIATVSAIVRRYLGGRRGGGSAFVGGMCAIAGGAQIRGNGCSVMQKTMLLWSYN